MELEGSLTHSRPPTTFLYPAVDKSIHLLPSDFFNTHFNVILRNTPSVRTPSFRISKWKPVRIYLVSQTSHIPPPQLTVNLTLIIFGGDYLLTYLLTPLSRVFLEKLTGFQLVKKFPAFYGNRRFITAVTIARHLSLSWASWIQYTHSNTTSWRSILILSSHLCLGLPIGVFPSGFPSKTLYTPLLSPIRTTCPIWRGLKIINLY